MITFRKATLADIDAIEAIYQCIHRLESQGKLTIGWQEGVYPIRETALNALNRGDLYVEIVDYVIVGSAILNQLQVDCYSQCHWQYPADDSQVMVMHTLTIDPSQSGKGYGKAFALEYERMAKLNHCTVLRIDTQAKNSRARAMYQKLGYQESAILPTDFNGIKNIQIVLLEKLVK